MSVQDLGASSVFRRPFKFEAIPEKYLIASRKSDVGIQQRRNQEAAASKVNILQHTENNNRICFKGKVV